MLKKVEMIEERGRILAIRRWKDKRTDFRSGEHRRTDRQTERQTDV